MCNKVLCRAKAQLSVYLTVSESVVQRALLLLAGCMQSKHPTAFNTSGQTILCDQLHGVCIAVALTGQAQTAWLKVLMHIYVMFCDMH